MQVPRRWRGRVVTAENTSYEYADSKWNSACGLQGRVKAVTGSGWGVEQLRGELVACFKIIAAGQRQKAQCQRREQGSRKDGLFQGYLLLPTGRSNSDGRRDGASERKPRVSRNGGCVVS